MTTQPEHGKSPAYWAAIRKLVAAAPPLSASQRDIIRRALRPAVDAAAARRLARVS
jgi:hypothetical protein